MFGIPLTCLLITRPRTPSWQRPQPNRRANRRKDREELTQDTAHCDVPVVPIGENNCQSRQPASLGPPLLFPLFSPSHRIITPVTRFAMCLALRILTYIARGQANINNALKSIMFACTSMASPSIASRLLFVRERHSLIHLLLHL